MPSYLSRKEGIFEPNHRYSFTNISETPFEIKWNSRVLKIVKPNETIEISDVTPYPGAGNGDAIARTKTIELATAIILGEAKVSTELSGFLTDKSYVSPAGTRAGIPEARRPYEEKILQELPVLEEDSIYNQMKADEIISDRSRQQGVSYSNNVPEFVNVPKGQAVQEVEFSIPKAKESFKESSKGISKEETNVTSNKKSDTKQI